MLCLIPAVAAFALGHAQTGSEDLSRLVPILASSAAFNREEGQSLRLASFVPPAESLGFLVASGVDLFVSETDKLTPPDAGSGIYDQSN
ncbi:MAG: hypothetical protein H0W86_08615 [Armatimonadetes bacterium]|nr:hypothetical protein [Armatimonadota bacterium]